MKRKPSPLTKALDYALAGNFGSELVNKPTKYRGNGRPKKTDYEEWKHPFDGKITRVLNY